MLQVKVNEMERFINGGYQIKEKEMYKKLDQKAKEKELEIEADLRDERNNLIAAKKERDDVQRETADVKRELRELQKS